MAIGERKIVIIGRQFMSDSLTLVIDRSKLSQQLGVRFSKPGETEVDLSYDRGLLHAIGGHNQEAAIEKIVSATSTRRHLPQLGERKPGTEGLNF